MYIPNALKRRAEEKLAHVANVWACALPCECCVSGQGLTRTIAFPETTNNDIEFSAITLEYVVRNKIFALLFDLKCSVPIVGAETISAPRIPPLNNLMRARTEVLGITHIAVQLSENNGCILTCSSLVGSATWNLIPPVLHAITPTPEECIRYTELLRMLACATIEQQQSS